MRRFKPRHTRVAGLAALAMLAIGAAPAGAACPNEEVRNEQRSTYLPECRAYELVSPVDKNGGNVAADQTMTQAAISGNAVKYTSTTAFGDALGSETRGAEYASQRGSAGWVTHGINPEQDSPAYALAKSPQYYYFSPDLTKGVYFALSPVLGGFPNVEKAANLYLRTDVLGAPPGHYELLSNAVAPVPARSWESQNAEVDFADASEDWSRIIFESYNDLTANSQALSTSEPKLYEWHYGSLTLAGVLSNGEPAEASIAGDGAGIGFALNKGWTQHTISSDGSRIVFTGPPLTNLGAWTEAGTLYMRVDGQQTIQLNASERTDCNIERREAEPSYKCTGAAEPDPNGPQPAEFNAATADDSKVFFLTEEALTDDAGIGRGLYMYDINAQAKKRLTYIAHASTADRGGSVNGISADGSYVYFTSSDVLTPDAPLPTGQVGNLYVWHEGSIRFVVARNEETGAGPASSEKAWGELGRFHADAFRVDPAGTEIAFASNDPETAERLGVVSPQLNRSSYYEAVYVYNYETDKLSCASCNRFGLPLSSDADFTTSQAVSGQDVYGASVFQQTMYLDRSLSDDGRHVFFDTGEALVPQDTNGYRDVYEYDTSTGEVHLISSGTCACSASFVDSSSDGSNVFFVTHEDLVAADLGTSGDMYDARVGGGFASQSEPAPKVCVGEECQPPAAPPPTLTTPSSAGFVGIGNAVEKAIAKSSPKRSVAGKQKLARALRHCTKLPRRKRAGCERNARHRYGRGKASTRTAIKPTA